MRILYKELNACNDSANLKELAAFLHIKSLYANSCIYNYSINSISNKSGISRHFLTKAIPMFKKWGWVREHHGNLVFVNYKHMGSNGTYWYTVKSRGFKEIQAELKFTVFCTKLRQIQFAAHTKQDHLDVPRNGEIADNGGTAMSVFTVAKLYNCSKSRAGREVKSFVSKGWLTAYKKRAVIVGKCPAAYVNAIQLDHAWFWKCGSIVRPMPNTYSINTTYRYEAI